MSKKKTWQIRDVILVGLIAIVFGVIYWGWGLAWNGFVSLLTPVALLLTGSDLTGALTGYAVTGKVVTAATVGLWMTAGPLAAMIIRKPGAALFGETFASIVEMVIGSAWGPENLIWGIVQGLGSELGFAITGYKNFRLGLWLSVLTGTIVAFGFNFFKYQYGLVDRTFVAVLFLIFFLSILVFAGLFVWIINAILIKSKLIKK
ncbi:MAG: ECF transporter S component [Lactobacillaceae bacterium]|jgi:energy-coupling factor transport system substrate-specific component|nr:ECF transporter S component [Lactobacillaceae bacterium]